MKILIATGLYAPEIGGPATHTALLEVELPKHAIDAVVYPFSSVRKYPKIVRHIVYTFGLMRRAKGASVMYALDPVSVGLPALIAARLTGTRFVLRVAGDYAWEQAVQRFGVTMLLDEFSARKSEQPFSVRILMRIESFVAHHAAEVVVPSNYLKQIVMGWGVPEEKITTIYNAFTPPVIPEEREALRNTFGYTDFVIVSAGRLVPWKGFAALIDALKELRDEGVAVSLAIAGDGPDQDALMARAQERDIADHVRFFGRLPQEELMRAIKGADIFALNTGYEGFSHQLLEVMALSVPVVTTPKGGNPELVEEEVTGLLVPYDDRAAIVGAVRRLVQDPDLRARLARAAYARAHSFTVPRMVEDIAKVLKSTQ